MHMYQLRSGLIRHAACFGLCLLALEQTGYPAITLTFSEVGDDVIAVASGSAVLPSIVDFDDFSLPFDDAQGTLDSLYAIPAEQLFDIYQGGSPGSATIVREPDVTAPFGVGYSDGNLYVGDHSVAAGDTWRPDGTITWSGRRLEEIFLGPLPTTPVRAYEFSNFVDGVNTNYIEVAIINVPEPAGATIVGLMAAIAAIRGRRSLA